MATPTKWGSEFLVNTTTDNRQAGIQIGKLADGFVATWFDRSGTLGDSGWSVRAQMFHADGTKAGGEFHVNTTTSGDQWDADVTGLPDGRFVAMWADYSKGSSSPEIRGQIFNPDGTPSGSEFVASMSKPEEVEGISVTPLSGGRFIAAWTADQGAAYTSDVHAQIFNPDGTRSGEFAVNTLTAHDQSSASMTELVDGRFIAIWTSKNGANWSIRAQIFDEDGSKSGPEFLVNPPNVSVGRSGSVTALADGFVLAWSQFGGAGQDIYAQVYDSNGAKSGAAFLVNTTTPNSQSGPVLAALPDGRFVAAWHDTSETGADFSAEAIRAQVFNPNGTKSGAEFLVNTTTDGAQVWPTITVLEDGRFVVGWTDHGATGADQSEMAVRAQIFDPRESPVTLSGTDLNDEWVGTKFNDTMKGGGGADRLDGAGGNDTLIGATENDTYVVDSFGDVVTEKPGEGNDTIISSVSYLLPSNVENLTLSPGATSGTGNDLDNVMIGNAPSNVLNGLNGNDTLDGGGGADVLVGGLGNDTYIVDDAGDVVKESAGEGADTIKASVDYTLPTGVENLVLLPGATNGTGNALDNVITGNAGNNVLTGGLGNDAIDGGAGDDTAVFSHNFNDCAVTDFGGKIVVVGPNGTDTLTSIEHLQFADATMTPADVANDGNALFDTLYYLSRNGDVFHAGVNALDHFNASGWHEGRDPNSFFDTSGYLAVNKDVAASGQNPLDHYHQIGWQQGRDPGADFDTALYLTHNPDVAAAGVDPLAHYLQNGMAEGRQAYAAVGSTANGFDAQYYLFHNPDVAAAGVDPLQHFNAYGCHEGRNPNGWFDTAGYLAHYADVAASGANPLEHYEQFGWHEGRDPSAGFDTLGYLAANPDVAAAGGNPLDHYLMFGIYEGRTAVNDGVWH